MDSPQLIKDLVRAEHDAKTFAEDYRGKLAALAAQDLADPKSHLLIDAVHRYEAFDELTGKLSSYARFCLFRRYVGRGAGKIL